TPPRWSPTANPGRAARSRSTRTQATRSWSSTANASTRSRCPRPARAGRAAWPPPAALSPATPRATRRQTPDATSDRPRSPARPITANLAPGDVRKAGPGLDLALACAILAATGQVPSDRLARAALLGELGLDGSVRGTRGALAVAAAARRCGLGALLVPPA